MTEFAWGMLALFLWVAAVIAAWAFMRGSPGDPARSIRRFRRVRRGLERVGPAPLASVGRPVANPASQELTLLDSQPAHPASKPQTPALGHPAGSQDSLQIRFDSQLVSTPSSPPAFAPGETELEEITRVIDAVTRPAPAKRPASSPGKASTRRNTRNSGLRKVGRTTYVLVDEHGNPLFEDRG